MSYRLIGWQPFIDQLKQVRILNLTGSMGTGKTLFSVALGYHLLREGLVRSAAFNFPVSFGSAPSPRWNYSVIDEAGTLFDARDSFKKAELNKLTASLLFKLRKLGSYIVVPSFIETDRRFRVGLRMWRMWALRGLLWAYWWELGPEEMEERRPGINYWDGRLYFYKPSHFFGTYDTYFAPGRNLSYEFLRGLLLERDADVHERARKAI